ncbi:MAG: hypothetical protein HFF43_07450 [Lawsonibacter sp.]|jgi:hypothetical protein|nr:hypothetical protein [Lawsonibacter sp.]
MSMPSFPQNGVDMTRDEALTMIIACIAMEELALSHILNAGGEHLQFVLGTLPGISSQDVLAAHKSITALIEAVTHNQMLLKNKLDHVLEFVPRPPVPSEPAFPSQPPDPSEPAFPSRPPDPTQPPFPSPPHQPRPYVPACPPPYPAPYPVPRPAPYRVLPREKSALQLAGQREKILWKPDCRLPWKQRSRSGGGICWDNRTPAQIQINSGKTYVVQYTLNVCAVSPAGGTGSIVLRQSPCGAFSDPPPLCLPMARLAHGPQTLQHVSVLHPCGNSGCGAELSLVLNAQTPLCVERAVMDIVEL